MHINSTDGILKHDVLHKAKMDELDIDSLEHI
jgi:hypothetical protein